MADGVFELFDEYAAAYARGERPRAEEYLERAGDHADDLAQLLDGFLAATPPPAPDADTLAIVGGWVGGDTPLLELRRRRGLTRDRVVDGLIRALALDRAKRDKVKRYYHELESGLLEPRRVDRRVFAAVADALKTRVDDVLTWRPPPALEPASAAFFRADLAVGSGPLRAPSVADETDAYDEIDALFLGRDE